MCNVCNVSVCIRVYGLSGRRQRGTARGGQTQQVREEEEENEKEEEEVGEVYWY